MNTFVNVLSGIAQSSNVNSLNLGRCNVNFDAVAHLFGRDASTFPVLNCLYLVAVQMSVESVELLDTNRRLKVLK